MAGRRRAMNNPAAVTKSAKNRVASALGAIHDWRLAEHWKFGLGGLYAFDFAPSSPRSSATAGYGSDPHGVMGFVRLVAE